MSETIGQRPWMTQPETVAVFDALEAAGGPDCARYVGGAVRNALIGRPVDEVDIATTLTPDEVTRALQAASAAASGGPEPYQARKRKKRRMRR